MHCNPTDRAMNSSTLTSLISTNNFNAGKWTKVCTQQCWAQTEGRELHSIYGEKQQPVERRRDATSATRRARPSAQLLWPQFNQGTEGSSFLSSNMLNISLDAKWVACFSSVQASTTKQLFCNICNNICNGKFHVHCLYAELPTNKCEAPPLRLVHPSLPPSSSCRCTTCRLFITTLLPSIFQQL